MLYTSKLAYTPALEPYEFDERALIIDTETVGTGPSVEVIELALGDTSGRIVFESLVRPAYNRLPPPSKHQRFAAGGFAGAPEWAEVWPRISALIEGKLLIAYNAAFDRRALAAMCTRHRTASPERGWRCAMQLVKRAAGIRKSLTLGDACARFGVEGGNHRAAKDVEATYRLLKEVSNL